MASKLIIETAIIKTLQKSESVDSLKFSKENNFDHNNVVSTIKSMEAKDTIKLELIKLEKTILTDMANYILENGSPEFLVFHLIPENGILKEELTNLIISEKSKNSNEMVKNGLSNCLKLKKISISKTENGLYVTKNKNAKMEIYLLQNQINQFKNSNFDQNCFGPNSKKIIFSFKKRKLIELNTQKTFKITKSNRFGESTDESSTLTPEMIKSGKWRAKTFKKYNYNAKGIPISYGALHPLLKVREEFRSIFLEMGFAEMATNEYVESSFWNFDSLFQPQQHPARDAHDTFFLKGPKHCDLEEDEEYLQNVKTIHENGGKTGSIGYRYKWAFEEAKKNILRTHTTAISAKTLFQVAKKDFKPVRFFSIDRVFRNETLDSTHLAEFHQIEGFVADYDLSLGDLIGTASQFFKRIGINDIKFKPAYNPYTEPSMEIFGFSKQLNKWIEVGNSGIFRPEMLLPMGLPERVSVIAWGFSLERPTMIKYGIGNIRDLFGHKTDLNVIKSNREIMF